MKNEKGGTTMNVSTCLNILREIKDVAFATVDENNQPQVRIIDVMLVEDNKLYFCTARGKDFYKQLKNHPYVAIIGMNKEYQMVRLNGLVKRLEKQKYWIDRIFKHNSSMNNVYPNESRYILEAFCLEEGELEFFDLGKEPIYRESFSVNKEIKPKGFIISNQCIQCGLCQKNCPQQCISNYQIQQEHCLHCGLCYEKCPVQAIENKVL